MCMHVKYALLVGLVAAFAGCALPNATVRDLEQKISQEPASSAATVTLSHETRLVGVDGKERNVQPGTYTLEAGDDSRLRFGTRAGTVIEVEALEFAFETGVSRPVSFNVDGQRAGERRIVLMLPSGRILGTRGYLRSADAVRELTAREFFPRSRSQELLITSPQFAPIAYWPGSYVADGWSVSGPFGSANLESTWGYMVAPVGLPDRAVIRRMSAHFLDVSEYDLSLELKCISMTGGWCGNPSVIAEVDSSGIDGGGSVSVDIDDFVVDHERYFMVLRLGPGWDSHRLGILAVKIDYVSYLWP